MTDASGDVAASGKDPLQLPKHPGPDPSRHVMMRYLETVEAHLADAGLLQTAIDGSYEPADAIIDTPLAAITALPPERQIELRMRYEMSNLEEQRKRRTDAPRVDQGLHRASRINPRGPHAAPPDDEGQWTNATYARRAASQVASLTARSPIV